jgi:hypothetical protein
MIIPYIILKHKKTSFAQVDKRGFFDDGGGGSRFSLRFGHGAALTPHCGVIHPRAGFSSPA